MPGRPSLRWKAGFGIAYPATSASGYPDASNTGVPAGTSLSSQSGIIATTSNNQVIENLDLAGTIRVEGHTGVIIRNCRFTSYANFFGVRCDSNTGGGSATVTDCTFGVASGQEFTGLGSNNLTVRRCRIQGSENGFDVGDNVTIEDCFIYGLYNEAATGTHADGAQIGDGSNNLIMRHNSWICDGIPEDPVSSCVTGDSTPVVDNWLITDNVFAGGAYSLRLPFNSTNCTVTSNKFWALWYGNDRSGIFGSWLQNGDVVADGGTVSGNELGTFSGGYDSTNKLISGSWSGVPLT